MVGWIGLPVLLEVIGEQGLGLVEVLELVEGRMEREKRGLGLVGVLELGLEFVQMRLEQGE